MYTYDVFVSYPHKQPAMDWVKNHFYPLLEQWLPNGLPIEHETRIFVDWDEIETGSAWPAKLSQALKRSRCILPIWSPDYFRSAWCMAEWKTMMVREQLLGLRTEQRPEGLVFPVVFFDGEHFPEEARQVQYRDLRKWNSPHPGFRETVHYVEFDRQMWSLTGRYNCWLMSWLG